MGRHVDMIYKVDPKEYVCMECGQFESDTTKELADGMFKIPIIMKEMFDSILKSSSSSLMKDIVISSLMIMGKYII